MTRRWSSTVALTVLFAALVTALGVLQWRWLYDFEDQERYQRERKVSFTTWQLKEAFDREIEGLASWLLSPSGTGDDAAGELAHRVAAWRASTAWPGLLDDVYVVAPGRERPLALSRLSEPEGALEPSPWPPALGAVADALGAASAGPAEAPTDLLVFPSVPAVVVPGTGPLEGWVVAALDEDHLRDVLLPDLVALLFPPELFDPVQAAVTDAATGRVVFSNFDAAAAARSGWADSVYGLVPAAGATERPVVLRPHGWPAGGPRSAAASLAEGVGADLWRDRFWSSLFHAGHWRLAVQHGDAPIPAQVAAIKARKATVGFGLLALLATSILMLTTATRRAQRAAREQLEQLARVSHELRTPLTVLSSAGDNLADGIVSGRRELGEYGRVIQRETRRLHDLVENVLHLARRRAGVPAAAPRPVDLQRLIDDVLATARVALDEAGFTVERVGPPRRVEVLGDPRALRSALLNLVWNAIQHARSGRWLRIAVETREREVRIEVADRGPGVDRRELPRLFEPYARGRRAGDTEGSGLGLAVVRDVARAHRGRVSVRSPDRGTAFVLHLPRRVAPEAG